MMEKASSLIGIGLGWIGLAVLPQFFARVGDLGVSLLLVAGLLYTSGGIVYARRRPDPIPSVFGYHELFHAFVVAAVAV
jgi:hemolysin III